MKTNASKEQKKKDAILYFKNTWMLYLMLILPMAFFLVFRYVPMTNIVVAFKDYNIFRGVWDSPWVGFHWFQRAFSDRAFFNALRNTIVLNILDLIVGFPAPIILAIILNELHFKLFKRFTQTVVYLPHFLSWIIISNLATRLLAPQGGILNEAFISMGMQPINFLMDPTLWVGTYVGLGVWKSVGWGSIIYLAAITAINPEIYEAAEVDGANRFGKIWHVTLPGLRPTIVVLLIINIGHILGIEFDRPFTLSNSLVIQVADVISTMVYRVGIRSFQFSYTAAIGLFQSVVGVIFLIIANTVAKRVGDKGIY